MLRPPLEPKPGELAIGRGPLVEPLVHDVGALIRAIHDASTGLEVPKGWDVLVSADQPDLVCHNDLAAWNLVIDGDRLVFIDWDGAGPSTRVWDLAYAAISFGFLFPGEPPQEAAHRLSALIEGYGADDALRGVLPATMTRRARAMYDLLKSAHDSGREPWGTMYAAGHGQHWKDTAEFIAVHETAWDRALT